MANPVTIQNLVRVGLSTPDNSPIDFSTMVPNANQVALGLQAEFFDVNASPRVFWVINAAHNGFDQCGGGGGGSTATGVPIPVSGPLTLVYSTHNAQDLIATGTPALSLANNLTAGFGCGIKGAFTLAAGAGLLSIGSGVTDLRSTTGTAWCSLVQTKSDGTTYDLVGTK